MSLSSQLTFCHYRKPTFHRHNLLSLASSRPGQQSFLANFPDRSCALSTARAARADVRVGVAWKQLPNKSRVGWYWTATKDVNPTFWLSPIARCVNRAIIVTTKGVGRTYVQSRAVSFKCQQRGAAPAAARREGDGSDDCDSGGSLGLTSTLSHFTSASPSYSLEHFTRNHGGRNDSDNEEVGSDRGYRSHHGDRNLVWRRTEDAARVQRGNSPFGSPAKTLAGNRRFYTS